MGQSRADKRHIQEAHAAGLCAENGEPYTDEQVAAYKKKMESRRRPTKRTIAAKTKKKSNHRPAKRTR